MCVIDCAVPCVSGMRCMCPTHTHPFPLSARSVDSYLAWWGLIQCVWCLFELDEQVPLQVIMAAGRVLMVLVMIVTVLVCDLTGNNSFNLPSDAPGHRVRERQCGYASMQALQHI